MSKKSKKQRAKTRKAEVRRQSGIVLRAVTPPSPAGKLLELRPQVTTPGQVASEPSAPSTAPAEQREVTDEAGAAPRAADEAAAPEVTRRDAIAPAKSEADGSPGESAAARRTTPEGAEVPPKTASAGADGPNIKAAEILPAKTASSGADAPKIKAASAPSRSVASAPGAPLEEQRASRRVALEVDIHLASESHFFSGLSGDISEGGLFLSTYRPLPVGTQVDVEFSLPGIERAVHAHGEVRWIREHSADQSRGVGIAFEGLADEDRDVIHTFCGARPPLYYEDVG